MVGTAQGRLCPPYEPVNAGEKFFRSPYPRPPNLAYPDRVLSDEGELSRSDPFNGQSESWPDRGAPERSTAWWPVERWEALRLALGARGCLAARGGYVNPASRVPIGALAPPTAPSPRAVREGFCKPRTLCAARMRKCGCLKIESDFSQGAFLTSPRSFAGRGRRAAPGEGPGTALPHQKLYTVERSATH